jgi:anti-sigma B factor antagonist
MNLNTKIEGLVTVISIEGDVDGKTAPTAQEQITALIKDGCKLALNMKGVTYMSSAGLRMLLSMRRSVPASGQIVLVGLPEQVRDTMSITGFLDFFTAYETLPEALEALK